MNQAIYIALCRRYILWRREDERGDVLGVAVGVGGEGVQKERKGVPVERRNRRRQADKGRATTTKPPFLAHAPSPLYSIQFEKEQRTDSVLVIDGPHPCLIRITQADLATAAKKKKRVRVPFCLFS